MRSIDNAERRARLAARHALIPSGPASGIADAAGKMVGLHSSDPATVYLSTWARSPHTTVTEIEQALYEKRSVVRILGMRRTLWVVPRDFASVVNSSSTVALKDRERANAEKLISSAGVADTSEWIDRVAEKTYAAIEERGEVLARNLTPDIPELQAKLPYYRKDGTLLGTVGMTTRILFLLSAQSRVMRARPAGSWISGQYRWATTKHWLGSDFPKMPLEDARADLLEHWLGRFGPASVTDMKWWTGWPMGAVRQVIGGLGAVEVEMENGPGFLLPDDLAPVASPEPWVAVLPSLDPTTMGWKERSWYLPDRYGQLFDRNGNAGPTVWVDGRIVGGWTQTKDGEIRYELFEDVGREAVGAIESKVEALGSWLGGVVVTPRFRSPHDKGLADS